jgi:hypothetical protein
VRYFGLDREIAIGKKVKILGKSCFEGCKHLDRIDFEVGSELERIDRSALRGCGSLMWIEIPVSVERIEESSCEGCTRLESCLISRDSSLVAIGERAFANCTSLRSFAVPGHVVEIGSNCFSECIYLYRLRFGSSVLLKRVLGDRSLDDGLEGFGVTVSSGLFKIEMEEGEVKLPFPGWSYIDGDDGEGDSELSLVPEIQ